MNDKELSKYLSLVLRHQPEKLGIDLDAEGYTSLPGLLARMLEKPRWRGLREGDIRRVVRESDKQRYEIAGDRIRARYGHSIERAVNYEPVEPPSVLYHGTSPTVLDAIRREGLRPMSRQYVHHSTETEQARIVGRRHHPNPVILIVRAHEAWNAGAVFHRPEDRLYISGPIPPQFLDFSDTMRS
jgi:putative RNA 2'-phosphotransferase